MSSDIAISSIKNIDVYTIRNVLTSSSISDIQKAEFMQKNRLDIKAVLHTKLDSNDYNMIIANRPLISFRPVINSFTKRGDKILLAQTLGIPEKDIEKYLKNTTETMQKDPQYIDKEHSALQTYVYRHGTKDEVQTFFNKELSQSQNLIKTLTTTLEYGNGGLADYYSRPIHRLSNKTFIQIYNIINKNITEAQKLGKIQQGQASQLEEWALAKLYQIQNDLKLVNAIKNVKKVNK